jgi:hypothetical protein
VHCVIFYKNFAKQQCDSKQAYAKIDICMKYSKGIAFKLIDIQLLVQKTKVPLLNYIPPKSTEVIVAVFSFYQHCRMTLLFSKIFVETLFVHVLVEYSYVLEGLTCPIDPPTPHPPYQLFLLYWIPFLYWISGGGAGYE